MSVILTVLPKHLTLYQTKFCEKSLLADTLVMSSNVMKFSVEISLNFVYNYFIIEVSEIQEIYHFKHFCFLVWIVV